MIDVLNAGPDFEARVEALEARLMAADDAFAAATVATLLNLDLPPAYRAVAEELGEDVISRGAAALYDPQAAWRGVGGDLPPCEGLLALSRGAQGRLSARLRLAADSGAASVSDGVIQALLDLAEDTQGCEADLAALKAPMREVAFSPRRLLGRVVTDVVVPGDDLRSVALRLYGDPERWGDVVVTYGLQPPYVSPTPRAGCLSPGVQLVTGDSRIPDAEIGALGETMRLQALPGSGGQEWDIVPAPEGGIATVSGALCLSTDCALRLSTPLGDLPEDPTYGMPEVPGLTRDEASATQYLLAAETLKHDSRVGSVSATAVPRGLKLMSNVVIVPANSESITYV